MKFSLTSSSRRFVGPRRQRLLTGAEDLFREVIRIDPMESRAIIGLSSTLIEQQKIDEARELLSQVHTTTHYNTLGVRLFPFCVYTLHACMT